MSDVNNKANGKKKRVPNWGHIIPVAIGGIILITVVVIVIRVAIWNRGEVAIIGRGCINCCCCCCCGCGDCGFATHIVCCGIGSPPGARGWDIFSPKIINRF